MGRAGGAGYPNFDYRIPQLSLFAKLSEQASLATRLKGLGRLMS